MKTQRIILNRALELLDKDLIIKGGDFKIEVAKEGWSGNRYKFLEDLESIAGRGGYDFESFDNFVSIKLIGIKEECEKKMLFIKDLL